jgi:hypothetical protein
MSKFTDTVKEDTPRLVVRFKINDDNKDMYDWYIHGAIPFIHLIGAIVKVQGILSTTLGWELDVKELTCPEQELVIAHTITDKFNEFNWFIHRDFPRYGMIGMLDLIRVTLVDTIRMKQANQRGHQPILGPDMKPIRKII